jgi:hypothetical protein
MSYVKIQDGTPVPYSFEELRSDNPNVSFSFPPSSESLVDFNVYLLNQDDYPEGFDVVDSGPIENRDGEWWQTWIGRDATPEEYRPEMVVTMRQARLALLSAGKLSLVNAAIAGLPEGEKEAAEIQWEYGSEVERLSPLVVGLMPALGMSEEEIDALFELARTL